MNLDKLKEQATDEKFVAKIPSVFQHLKAKDQQYMLTVIKVLFFSPETHPQVRYIIADYLGKINHQQVFNQVLSYFILKTFPDKLSLIRALKSFSNPMAIPALTHYYTTEATWEERLEIIDTLAAIQTPETVEFLSHIHNGKIEYGEPIDQQQSTNLRERASSALSKHLMRFD